MTYIAFAIFFVLGAWSHSIWTSGKIAEHEAFSEELGAIVLKQMEENDELVDENSELRDRMDVKA